MRVRANHFDRLWDNCGDEVVEATRAVGASGWYILGEEVKLFESALAAHCGTQYAVGCGNGMDALEISLRGLGLRAGQKVLTTPLSAFATTLAIVRAGGIPVFCDVDAEGLIDLDRVEDCLTRHPDIRFLVPVHLYGHVVDLSRLGVLRQRYDCVIVEDAAQAIGAHRDGKAIGSAGQTACFSFYPTKNLGAFGDGGAIITDDEKTFHALSRLRNYGQQERYVHTVIGLNSRLDELHAAILRRALLPKLSTWTRRRREIADLYCSGINHPSVSTRRGPDLLGSVWHLFPTIVPPDRRASFLAWLRQSGVDGDVHYPHLITDQSALTALPVEPLILDPLKCARKFATQEVSLPINPFLTNPEVAYVIAIVNAWGG